MTYERKCENWIKTFCDWTLPRCESPETFVYWSGLFILASALRRQVKVPKKYLGSWECPPHLYVLFVGDAGKVRKTTAANFGSELLDEISFIKRGPIIVSQASLLTGIVDSPDSSLYLISEEFHDLIMKSGDDMFGFLTSLFDGKKNIEASTISRGVEFAQKPCVNLLAATTPQWISNYMPEVVIGGGFASRTIFILEEHVRQRRMYYKEVYEKTDFDKIKDALLSDLKYMAEKISGDFEIDKEAQDFMETWYQANADNPTGDYRLSGYYQRKPAHIHKVAMLLHLSRSDELILHKSDFERAIKVLEHTEKNLPKVFEGMGKNPYTVDLVRMKEYVHANEPVNHSDLLAHFAHAAEPWKLNELVKSLVTMDEIIKFENGNGHQLYASPKFVIKRTAKAFDPNDIETWNY